MSLGTYSEGLRQKVMSGEITASNFQQHITLKELDSLARRVRKDAAEHLWKIYLEWEKKGDITGLEWIPEIYERPQNL